MHNAPDVGVRGPAPEKGEHTNSVLNELLDLTDEQLAELESHGIIGRGQPND